MSHVTWQMSSVTPPTIWFPNIWHLQLHIFHKKLWPPDPLHTVPNLDPNPIFWQNVAKEKGTPPNNIYCKHLTSVQKLYIKWRVGTDWASSHLTIYMNASSLCQDCELIFKEGKFKGPSIKVALNKLQYLEQILPT